MLIAILDWTVYFALCTTIVVVTVQVLTMQPRKTFKFYSWCAWAVLAYLGLVGKLLVDWATYN